MSHASNCKFLTEVRKYRMERDMAPRRLAGAEIPVQGLHLQKVANDH
jgi:hypothetical protein